MEHIASFCDKPGSRSFQDSPPSVVFFRILVPALKYPIDEEGNITSSRFSEVPVFHFSHDDPPFVVLSSFPFTPATKAMSGKIQKTDLFDPNVSS